MFKFPEFEGAQPLAPQQSTPGQSRRELLESSKLSRLPEIKNRKPFQLPDIAPTKPAIVCVNCKVKLDEYSQPLKYARVCRKCISAFTVIETELDSAEKRKRREQLEKLVGGAGND
jgi:hypothetical protein